MGSEFEKAVDVFGVVEGVVDENFSSGMIRNWCRTRLPNSKRRVAALALMLRTISSLRSEGNTLK